MNKDRFFLPTIYSALLILGFTFISVDLQGQFGQKGFLFSVGMGSGFSTHADSYQFEDLVRIREFPGFRIFIFETKIGWTLSEQTAIYITGNVAPGNTTITPYRSSYAGIAISQSLGYASSFYVKGGVGYYSAAIEKGKKVGTGILTNLSIGLAMSAKSYIELNTYFGKLDDDNYLDPNPFNSGEFQISVLISYAIF